MNLSRLFRLAALLLVPALLSNSLAFAAKKHLDPDAIKAKIEARGVGQGVRVTLADSTEVKGMIVAVHEHTFVVKPKHADQPREIEYAQVTGVHNDHLTRGQKVGITVGVVAGALAITVAVIVSTVRIW